MNRSWQLAISILQLLLTAIPKLFRKKGTDEPLG